MSIAPLPPATVKLITSTQAITSVSTAVKELIENSLDAGSTSIDVKLDNNGLDRIEVKDDGAGISQADAPFMALPHYTSKISSFSDIETLASYGFRGEALNALCHVGNVVVTTATTTDPQGTIYVLDKDGRVASSKPTHKIKGTSIVVSYLFKNVPVRRQFLSNGRRAKDELRAVETIVKTLAVINPQVRFALAHNRCLIWQKTSCTELRQGLVYMLGYTPARELHELKAETAEMKIEALVPRLGCDISILSKSTLDSSMVFINRRPVQHKIISKVATEFISQHFGERLLHRKNPIFLISFLLNPTQLDINLEPNKTRVLVKDEEILLEELKKLLSGYYGSSMASDETGVDELAPKRRKTDASEMGFEVTEPGNRVSDLQEEIRSAPTVEIFEKAKIQSSEPLQVLTTNQPKYPLNDSPAPAITIRDSEPESDLNEKENFAENRIHTENSSHIHENERPPSLLDQSINPEKWSMGHLKGTSGNFVQPSVIINPPAARPLRSSLSPPPRSTTNIAEARSPAPRDKEEENLPNLGDTDVSAIISSIERSEFDKDWQLPASRERCSENLNPVRSPPRPRLVKNRRKGSAPQPLLSEGDNDMNLSTASVSSQMGRKELAGFTKFARDVRPQIILENPGISFTKVAVLLVNKWRDLPIEEKDLYEDKAREHASERKAKSDLDIRQLKLPFGSKEVPMIANPPPTKPKRPTQWKSLSRSEIPWKVSMDAIRERLSEHQIGESKRSEPGDKDMVPVGHLQPSGGWLCLKGGQEVFLVSTCRLQEVVVTHRLLSVHSIPLRALPFAHLLDEKSLGNDNWNTLMGLDRAVCDLNGKTMVISSPIIVKNGFRIQLAQKESLEVSLTHVAETMSYYGVEELRETLQLAAAHGTSDLSMCRPKKVVCHLKGEAVRICRQDPSIMGRSVLQELLLYWKTFLSKTELCLHSKPIWTHIHTLVPATDSAS